MLVLRKFLNYAFFKLLRTLTTCNLQRHEIRQPSDGDEDLPLNYGPCYLQTFNFPFAVVENTPLHNLVITTPVKTYLSLIFWYSITFVKNTQMSRTRFKMLWMVCVIRCPESSPWDPCSHLLLQNQLQWMQVKRVFSNGWTRNLLVRFYTLHLAPTWSLGGRRWRSSPLVSRQASNTSYSQHALATIIQLLHQTHSPTASLQVLQIHPLFFGNGYARRRSIIFEACK